MRHWTKLDSDTVSMLATGLLETMRSIDTVIIDGKGLQGEDRIVEGGYYLGGLIKSMIQASRAAGLGRVYPQTAAEEKELQSVCLRFCNRFLSGLVESKSEVILKDE